MCPAGSPLAWKDLEPDSDHDSDAESDPGSALITVSVHFFLSNMTSENGNSFVSRHFIKYC